MSASETSISAKAEVAQDRHDDDRAADDHVDAAGIEAGIVAALRDRLGCERAEHVFGGLAGQAEVVDGLGVVGR